MTAQKRVYAYNMRKGRSGGVLLVGGCCACRRVFLGELVLGCVSRVNVWIDAGGFLLARLEMPGSESDAFVRRGTRGQRHIAIVATTTPVSCTVCGD